MTKLNYTAAFMTGLITLSSITPLLSVMPASAQLFPSSGNSRTSYPNRANNVIPVNTQIPVRYDKAEKIIVSRDETVSVTLQVGANLKNRYGNILIPYNSEIVGRIEPYGNGSRFVAEELVINDNIRYPINAASEVVTTTEVITKDAKLGTFLKNAAIGAAAAAIISGVTGDRAIATEEVLAGAGAGAIGTLIFGKRKVEVISIDPNNDLDIRLLSALNLEQ